MKISILILLFCLLTFPVHSQTPAAFKYQAAVRDNSGNILANKSVTFRISILQGGINGSQVYSELHAKITSSLGLVDLEIGNGTSPSGSFSSINWAVSTYFIKIEMDPAGGIAFQMLGTSQLLSVPYALMAKDVESVSTDATLTGSGNDASPLKIAPQSATGGQVLKWNGTTWKPGSDLTGTTSPGGTSGQVQFNNGGSFGGNGNLIWDNTNLHLGIGIASPGYPLHVLTSSDTGVYGETSYSGGIGIFGNATAAGGAGTGVKGSTSSAGGYGVYGYAGPTTSASTGVCGWATSASGGIGVQGINAATSGTTYGIYGRVSSSDGYSGYFSGSKFYVSGKAGFGTSAPATTVDINGTLKVGSTGSAITEIRSFTGTLPNNPDKWDEHWDYRITLPSTDTWEADSWCILSIEVRVSDGWWYTTPISDFARQHNFHSTNTVVVMTPPNAGWEGHMYRIVIMRF
jgi:trimeric autotransporter adhesin